MKYFLCALVLCVTQTARAENPAVGLASDFHAVRTTDTALTALFGVNDQDLIQGYFVFANSDAANTGTSFGIAGTYKHLISGSDDGGFHIGGGLGMGSFPKDKSFVHINGVIGFRFVIAKYVTAHVDGGLSIGSADSKTEFLIGGNSALFGLTLAYQL
jgi:hypothetical protein